MLGILKIGDIDGINNHAYYCVIEIKDNIEIFNRIFENNQKPDTAD